MTEFSIAHSEAFLLGLCLQEYLNLKKYIPHWSFLGALRQRVEPYVPDLRHQRTEQIDASDIPADLQWDRIGDVREGRSPSLPHTIFVRDGGRTYKRVLDHSRHNLINIVVLHLDDAIGLSKEFRRYIHRLANPESDFAEAEAEYLSATRNFGDRYSDFDGNVDQPEQIKSDLVSLAVFSECEGIFQLGREFGQLITALGAYQCGAPQSEYVPRLMKATTQLWQANAVQNSVVISSALKYMLRRLDSALDASVAWRLSDLLARKGVALPESSEELAALIEQVEGAPLASSPVGETERQKIVADVLSAIWLAIGELLGSLRDVDTAFTEVEYALPAPRGFRILSTDSPSRVRDLIADAEGELNKPSDIPHLPERVVGMLVYCIEPLTRSCWPNDPSRTVAEILRNRLTSTNPIERRFASVAFSLWKSYRNDVAHAFDKFACSFEEARYVLEAVRVMHRLAVALGKRGGGSSGTSKL